MANREIKFRAWDGKVMHVDLYEVEWLTDGSYNINEDVRIAQNGLMQYTGLKDKNGREIYEDDILRNGGFICTVDYENGAFQLVAIETSDEGCWDLLFDLCRHRNTDGVEVIGNIHENPVPTRSP